MNPLAVLLCAAVLSGCFNPQINEGKRCGSGDSCPPGFVCGEDQICRSENPGDDGSVSDGKLPDAAQIPDAGANDAITLVDASVPSTPHITLFAHPSVQGDFGLGGRAAVDNMCGDLAAQTIERCAPVGSSYFAFLSIDGEDSIVRLPENFGVPSNLPVLSAGGVVLADTFADMFQSSPQRIAVSLAAAGVLPPDTNWWSGSSSGGETASRTCNTWSVGGKEGANTSGAVGRSNETDSSWILSGTASCNSSLPFLCICYPP